MIGRNNGEAKVRYLDGDFQVITPGTHVRCAITGRAIALSELRYWSVDAQEAYADAAAAYQAFVAAQKVSGSS